MHQLEQIWGQNLNDWKIGLHQNYMTAPLSNFVSILKIFFYVSYESLLRRVNRIKWTVVTLVVVIYALFKVNKSNLNMKWIHFDQHHTTLSLFLLPHSLYPSSASYNEDVNQLSCLLQPQFFTVLSLSRKEQQMS